MENTVRNNFIQSLAPLNRDNLLILVVDDHPVNRNLLSRQLKALGLSVMLAADGVEALSCWRNHKLDLIITDSEMTEMDGCTLASTIREIETREERSPIPIVVWTAKTLPEEIAKCTKAGMSDYLSKPATQKELTEILIKWLTATAATPLAARDNKIPVDQVAATGTSCTAANHTDIPVFDPDVLIDMLGDDPMVCRELIDSFLEAAQDSAIEIQRAIETHDVSTLAKVSHKLKSSSRIIGALQFSSTCETLEHIGRNAAWSDVQPAYSAFQAAFKRMNMELAR